MDNLTINTGNDSRITVDPNNTVNSNNPVNSNNTSHSVVPAAAMSSHAAQINRSRRTETSSDGSDTTSADGKGKSHRDERIKDLLARDALFTKILSLELEMATRALRTCSECDSIRQNPRQGRHETTAQRRHREAHEALSKAHANQQKGWTDLVDAFKSWNDDFAPDMASDMASAYPNITLIDPDRLATMINTNAAFALLLTARMRARQQLESYYRAVMGYLENVGAGGYMTMMVIEPVRINYEQREEVVRKRENDWEEEIRRARVAADAANNDKRPGIIPGADVKWFAIRDRRYPSDEWHISVQLPEHATRDNVGVCWDSETASLVVNWTPEPGEEAHVKNSEVIPLPYRGEEAWVVDTRFPVRLRIRDDRLKIEAKKIAKKLGGMDWAWGVKILWEEHAPRYDFPSVNVMEDD
ncbi:hypothetical protein CONLIGDRAFT_30884 [Coniochaeta ligniaria NRRL 30616]|uniref:Uncharacterized protein n=1 Tax=Coniochaeta ligniaria NRRL 30616 TaxID=1408157 RepID=A0A1J7J552_9PEZI|nr:hypothetical protein CONLIGDRAFT_30884 [Coniochaeta ligniaria NRRL 30616]